MSPGRGFGHPAARADAAAGAVLDDRYLLTGRLGRGGMAEVWAADDLVLRRPVAVKMFRFGSAGAEVGHIDAEKRTLAALSHPGVVRVYNAGAEGAPSGVERTRTPYLVMELVDGQTLSDRIAQGPLSAVEVHELGAQLSDTLAYLHGRGVVHRDIKPANLLLHAAAGDEPPTLRARLTDFGVARLVGSTHIAEIGITIGTPNYLSPEQATGAEAGPPTDVYALGLVLLESHTAQVAYPGFGAEAALARLRRPPHIPDALGEGWSALLRAMTAAQPVDRPSAAEVSAELGGWQAADRTSVG